MFLDKTPQNLKSEMGVLSIHKINIDFLSVNSVYKQMKPLLMTKGQEGHCNINLFTFREGLKNAFRGHAPSPDFSDEKIGFFCGLISDFISFMALLIKYPNLPMFADKDKDMSAKIMYFYA